MIYDLFKPKAPEAIEAQSDVFRSLVPTANATYVAVPITTGKRFQEWFLNEGVALRQRSPTEYKKRHFEAVIEPNIKEARKYIEELREQSSGPIYDPSAYDNDGWDQNDYRWFWTTVIKKYVSKVVFLDSWQFSVGCSFEYFVATSSNTPTLDQSLNPLPPTRAIVLIEDALPLTTDSSSKKLLSAILEELKKMSSALSVPQLPAVQKLHFKDKVLDSLSEVANVAQFISFSPELEQRYSRLLGFPQNHVFEKLEEAIDHLLKLSRDGMVNVRSFDPAQPKGRKLVYGLRGIDEVISVLLRNKRDGTYSIVNEAIDIHDGGVSGVLLGDAIEFSPDDTPQCVDKPGVCSLPREVGLHILELVYGFKPNLDYSRNSRVEFSIHPKRRGFKNEQTIIWEIESNIPYLSNAATKPPIIWPNNFSKHIGDKAFGLLVGYAVGLMVPKTAVIARRVALFTFAYATGLKEVWLRTCPLRRSPGTFKTVFGWEDPFELMKGEENMIARDTSLPPVVSLLVQDAVNPIYSGSCVPMFGNEASPCIEGTEGPGDLFMLGKRGPQMLPDNVLVAVAEVFKRAAEALGPVEMEWVFDGHKVWVVQLHIAKHGRRETRVTVDKTWHNFKINQEHTEESLKELKAFCRTLNSDSEAVILLGDVGSTSHFGDTLRDANLDFVIDRQPTE